MVANRLLLNYIHIGGVVSLYWIVSITTVFVNKTLLSEKEFDAPFTVLWYQCFISVIICLLLKVIGKLYFHNINFPDASPLQKEAIVNVFPVSVLLTSMIVFNALCLKYVGVSFYYIGRSLTTIFNVILTYLIMKEKISGRTLACCSAIVLGFLLGVDQESDSGTFSFFGTLAGILASLSLSLYSVYVKKALPLVNNSILLLSLYNNMYSCALLLPCIILNDELVKINFHEKIFDWKFWLLMTIGGTFGFSMGYVTSLQISVTSPLTHNISGTAKACAQTLIATFWYIEKKSLLWWFSNFIILFGSFAYASVKQQEMKQKFTSKSIIY